MTPKVRDILITARRDIHAATAEHANISDAQTLFTLDHIITADAARSANAPVVQSDMVCHLAPDDDEDTPTEKLPPKSERVKPSLTQAERDELERLRKEKLQDTAIIDGLRARLEGGK